MPKPLTIKIPAPGVRLTFANRARRRAGLGSFMGQPANPPLPAPNVFAGRGMCAFYGHPATGPVNSFAPLARGMGAFYGHPATPPPNFFAPLARGVKAFFAKVPRVPLPVSPSPVQGLASFYSKPVRVPLPAQNIFPAYAPGRNCSTCSKRCFKRTGMGQDDGEDIYTSPILMAANAGLTSSPVDITALPLQDTSLTQAAESASPTGIIFSPNLSPVQNQQLSAGYNNPSVSASQLSQAASSMSLGNAVQQLLTGGLPAANATNVAAGGTAVTPTTSQTVSGWLAGSSLISGVSNGTVAAVAVAGVAALAVLSNRKKGRK